MGDQKDRYTPRRNNMNTSVVVLAGGWSRERDVSLMGSECIVSALRGAGYDVRVIDVQRDMSSLIRALRPQPDVVYNALHGPYGEDGCIQGMLECLGIRYTHSGVLASALAMDKPMAKLLFQTAGIPCLNIVSFLERHLMRVNGWIFHSLSNR